MNKSTIFKTAHKQARKIVSIIGDYRLAFQFALKEIYAMKNKPVISTEEKLLDLGMKVWEKNDKRRIYINTDYLEPVFGLVYCAKTGNVRKSSLNGEPISNNKAWKYKMQTHYYDCNAETFVSSLIPII